MAVKAYYGGPGWPQGGSAVAGGRGGWVAPKTLGNPDGALSGGGAYLKGGDNKDGPNQGGGGGGGGGTNIMAPFGFGSSSSTGPSLNGPGQTCGSVIGSAFAPTPSGLAAPLCSPDPFVINGVDLSAFGEVGTSPFNLPPTGLAFIVILFQAGLPQNHFANVSFTTGGGNVYSLDTSSAQFNTPWDDTGTGFTTWIWLATLEPFFPPTDFSNPITFTW